MENKLPLYRIKVNPDDETGVYAVSLVDEPAIEVDWIKLSKQVIDFEFSVNKDKQLLYGPLLVPNKLIYRRDEKGNEYNIVFDKETIEIIADKYNKNKLGDIFNFQHSDKKVEAYLRENWLVENPDKSNKYGFELEDGTWFGSVKVQDEEFWMSEVKTEKVKGFSVELRAGVELIEMEKTSDEDKNKKINLMEVKTKDGLTLSWDGDAEVGKEIFIILEDGSKEPLSNGEYELEDGTKIIAEDGKVKEIMAVEAPAENADASTEEMADPIAPESTTPDQAIIDAVAPYFEEFRNLIADLSSRLDALENVETTQEEATETEEMSKIKELEDKIEILSKMAGAPSVSVKNDREEEKRKKEDVLLSKINTLRGLKK